MKKRPNPAKPKREPVPSLEVPASFKIEPPKQDFQMTPAYAEVYPDKKGKKA